MEEVELPAAALGLGGCPHFLHTLGGLTAEKAVECALVNLGPGSDLINTGWELFLVGSLLLRLPNSHAHSPYTESTRPCPGETTQNLLSTFSSAPESLDAEPVSFPEVWMNLLMVQQPRH